MNLNIKKQEKKQSESRHKNSLFILEDHVSRIIIDSLFTSKLKIPITYVKNYSNELNDFYLEKLYDYLIKWLVSRYLDDENSKNIEAEFLQKLNNNINTKHNQIEENNLKKNNHFDSLRTELSEDIHLDDSDCIRYRYVLNIIMKVIMNANIMNKQKCLIDFYMLTIYNRDNSVEFLKNKYFLQWLLDLLLPYQIIIANERFKESKKSGIAFTILDLGMKIHSAIIINSILNDKNYGNETYILKDFNFLLTWMFKIKTIGESEGIAASQLIRNIFYHIIKNFSESLILMSPSVKAPMWYYFLHLTFIIYEFIFYSNFDKKIIEKRIIFDQLEKNEICAEIIQNLNYDFNQENKYQGKKSNANVSMIDFWLDKELLITLLDSYKVIWKQINLKMVITEKQSFFNFNLNIGSINNSSSNKDNHKTNQNNVINSGSNANKNTLNNNNIGMKEENESFLPHIEKEDKIISDDAYNFKTEGDINYSFNQEELKVIDNKINKLIFETSANYYMEDLKLFMFTYNYTGMNSQSEKNPKNNLMRIILNSLLILIMLSENLEEIQKWLNELEKFISFVIIASENSRLENNYNNSANEAFLISQQECVSEIFIITLYFLSDEIKSPRREKFSNKNIQLFNNTIKFLFVNICLIIEKIDYINNEISKKKETALSSYITSFKNMLYMGSKTTKYFSASYKLYSEYLKNLNKNRLFNISDIQNWKLRNFNETLNLFNDENWIFAFQENSISFEIIKNQFQFNLYEKIINLKLLEAQDIIINIEIGTREKAYINQLYRSISSSIRESLSFIDRFLKKQIFKIFFKKKKNEYCFYKIQKTLFLLKGAWSEFNYIKINNLTKESRNNINNKEKDQIKNNIEQIVATDFYKYKVSSHISTTLSRNILVPIFNIKKYLPNFSKYVPQNLFLDSISNKNLINDNYYAISNNNCDLNLNINHSNNYFGILEINYENSSLDESSNNLERTFNAKKDEENNLKNKNKDKNNKEKEKEKEKENAIISDISILKVKQITNKSNMFYRNSHFSDFIDKYANIEKLTKYFKLFYEKDFKLIIINLTEFFINKIKNQNIINSEKILLK